MRTRPAGVSDDAVLTAVRDGWAEQVSAVDYLPVGFGAHHWTAVVAGTPSLFVTLDLLAERHDADSLERTYAAAALLARSLDFVCAPLPDTEGRFTRGVGEMRLSVTPWSPGRTPSDDQAGQPDHRRSVADMLDRLHGCPPPPGLREWAPAVSPDFADRLYDNTSQPWAQGPLGELARQAVLPLLDQIAAATARYRELATAAQLRRSEWVVTHGEPHAHNQMVTAHGIVLVDWESMLMAPRERDLAEIAEVATPPADTEMLELMTLDWRLSEIAEFTTWFALPHTGGLDDETALQGLRDELAELES